MSGKKGSDEKGSGDGERSGIGGNYGLTGQGKDRINLSCLVDALSVFKKAPEKPGEVFYLMVETMAHKVNSRSAVFSKQLHERGHNSYITVKLIAVMYELPDGSKALTWEVE